MKAKNIMEDIVTDYLNQSLSLKYDICRCKSCREDMLAYALSRLPSRYVTTDKGAMYILIQQAKGEWGKEIVNQVIEAINVISKNPRHKSEDRNQAFQLLLDKILLDRHLELHHYREHIIKRRIALRMRQNDLSSYSEYARLLTTHPEEYQELFKVLMINYSVFFRDPAVWDYLENRLLKELIDKKLNSNKRYLNIWSAGCANGEEPYTLAIALKRILERINQPLQFKILASDIDDESLKIARSAVYDPQVLKNLDKSLLDEYFIPEKKGYRVKDEIKEMVNFSKLDLIADELPVGQDLVLCRNVFIYFSRSLQERLLSKIYQVLNTKGYLVMGLSEILLAEAQTLFREINSGNRAYQKV